MTIYNNSILEYLKEITHQHSASGTDHARYHTYLTTRISKLRSQQKKKSGIKNIPGITDSSKFNDIKLLIGILLIERAISYFKELNYKILKLTKELRTKQQLKSIKHKSNSRCNKVIKLSLDLLEFIDSLPSENSNKSEAKGYIYHSIAQSLIYKEDYQKGKEYYILARSVYYQLLVSCNSTLWYIVHHKVTQCDEEICYIMKKLGEDTSSYVPDVENFTLLNTQIIYLPWINHKLSIVSPNLKQILHDIKELKNKTKISIQSKRHSISKTIYILDCIINLYTEGLTLARNSQKINELKLIEDNITLELFTHYIQFSIYEVTVEKTLLLVQMNAYHYYVTLDKLAENTGLPHYIDKTTCNHKELPKTHATPMDIIKLADLAIESLHSSLTIPGIDCIEKIEEQLNTDIRIWECYKIYWKGEIASFVNQLNEAQNLFNEAMEQAESITNVASMYTEILDNIAKYSKLSLSRLRLKYALLGHSNTINIDSFSIKSISDSHQVDDQALPSSKIMNLVPQPEIIFPKPFLLDIATTFISLPHDIGISSDAPNSTMDSTTNLIDIDKQAKSISNWFKGWSWN